MTARKKNISSSPLLSQNIFFLFNFLSQLNTLGNLKVFSIRYSSEKSYHQMACSFSSNIVHVSAPASPSVVAAVQVENRNETLMVSYPVLLHIALAQPLLSDLALGGSSERWVTFQRWDSLCL